MNRDLHNYRKSYQKGTLDKSDVLANPMEQFRDWFRQAEISNTVEEVNAMTLSTVDNKGMPRGRIVLLKEVTKEGFIFYTNYGSKKGQAIEHNSNVSLSFFWPSLEQQIIIEGNAIKVSEEKSLNYFKQRPKDSQLGALVSNQSQEVKDRETIENRLASLVKEYEGKEVPKPENWGGFIVKPEVFEFWQGRHSRLHDRMYYIKTNNSWEVKRLQP